MKTFKNKFVALFVFLIVIIIAGGFLIFNTALMHKSDGMLINLAGRQRMLIQKFTKEFFDSLSNRQILAAAKQYAKVVTNQIKVYRTYYTKNIVGKLQKELPGIQASANYHNVKGAIPLPATFLRETSESLKKISRFRYDLISKWNINKDSGLRDEFEQKAWDSLSKNPDIPYAELLPRGAGVEFRYATADMANIQTCVSCHNSNPDSPKSDFKMGEIMGILIISTPVTLDERQSNKAQPEYILDDIYENTRKLFEVTLKTLRHGGSTFKDLNMTEPVTISASSNEKIDAKLDKVGSLWKDMQRVVDSLRTEEVNSPPYLKLIQNLRDLNIEVLQEMNQAVAMYEADSMVRVNKLQIIALVIVVIIILIVLLMGVFVRDLAFHKRVEESEERYRSLAETAHDAIISANKDGNIISWNKGAQAIFGHKEEDVLGKSLTILIPERYKKAHINGLKLAVTTGKLKLMGKVVEIHGLRKDKSEFPLEVSLGTWKAGESIFFSAIIRDITERKQTEEKLRKLSQAVEQSPASVMITDTEGCIEYCNPNFCKVTGYSFEEVVGQNPKILKSDEKSSEDYQELWSMITSGKDWRGEFHNKKKNGELFWELASISPIKNPDGEITHFLAVKEDITKRKQIEEELAKERRNLKKTVKTRTQELRESIKNLEKTNLLLKKSSKAKSDFLASMSHELRTPLNSILGFAQVLESYSDIPLVGTQKVSVSQILKSGNHLLRLINEVLDLAKIESGTLSISFEILDAGIVLAEVLTLMEPIAKERNISIIDKTPKDKNIYLKGDLTRLKQIFLNLVSNAIKYNEPEGSVTISTEVLDEKFARISIKDTGSGISKDNIPRLFEPFDRLEAESMDIEGTGVGLTISMKLVELMDGKIGVESEVGEGSIFYVDLPLSEKPDEETGGPKEIRNLPDESAKGEWKLLYVEDNPSNLQLMEIILARRPEIEMLSAPDAKLGIELAIAHKPDLILMDINLPGMNGFEALKELRSLEETRNIPVLALSANAMNFDIKKGKKAGFVDYLTKPIDIKIFLKAVDKVLAKWS